MNLLAYSRIDFGTFMCGSVALINIKNKLTCRWLFTHCTLNFHLSISFTHNELLLLTTIFSLTIVIVIDNSLRIYLEHIVDFQLTTSFTILLIR